jgi:hypothetical protein
MLLTMLLACTFQLAENVSPLETLFFFFLVKLFIFGFSLNKITVHTRLRYYCIDRSGGSPQRA